MYFKLLKWLLFYIIIVVQYLTLHIISSRMEIYSLYHYEIVIITNRKYAFFGSEELR
jgi:hypothetical protein